MWAHLLPRVRRRSQQTKLHTIMVENTPARPSLTEMEKHNKNPTSPILQEHHQISPQIDHLCNLWIQPFPCLLIRISNSSNFPLLICPSGMQLHWWCNCYEKMEYAKRHSHFFLDKLLLHQFCTVSEIFEYAQKHSCTMWESGGTCHLSFQHYLTLIATILEGSLGTMQIKI